LTRAESVENTKSVSFYTLGCKLNFSESSALARQLQDRGLTEKPFTEGADIYVINTCSVTDHADKKCRKVVQEALGFNPRAQIIVTGCYAQLRPEEIAGIPGVRMVLGAAEKFRLYDHIQQLGENDTPSIHHSPIKEVVDFVPGFSIGHRTRAFLKVQDGCDYFCSFCTIPLARGKSRSLNIKETLEVAAKLQEENVKEVVLTGCNLGDFGVQHQEHFFQLVQELDRLEFIKRYRISSIEPNLLSDELIAFVASSRAFLPHFHLPLQSGSPKILQSMRRKYTRDLYAHKVNTIKSHMPDCAIGVDVIVGFPGESHEDFLDTYHFLRELDITYLHVFPYSERPNTTAIKLKDKVNGNVKHERTQQLRQLSEKKKRDFYQRFIGQTMPVLLEAEEKRQKMHGFTPNYIKVSCDYDPLLVNEITPITITGIDPDTQIAEGWIPFYQPHTTHQ
jgi:threonylcarbamoyladenosine tRNA methylthiotransferase MtaB